MIYKRKEIGNKIRTTKKKLFRCHRNSYDIRTQNTENKPELLLVYKEDVCQTAGLLFKIPHKILSCVPLLRKISNKQENQSF